MAEVSPEITEVVEGRVVHLSDRPITFDQFADWSGKRHLELVNGVIAEKPMVQLEHEYLSGWLYVLLKGYAKKRDLGIVVTSRVLVEINQFGGRLPDLLFVSKDRLHIVSKKAIHGAPNLIIEIISPNDRASDVIALETDYRSIGVDEIIFIDQPKKRLRILRQRGTEYEEELLDSGEFRLETLNHLTFKVEWLFSDTRPDEYDLLTELLKNEIS